MILAPLLKLPKNVEDLGKFIVAKGFKKLPQSAKNRQLWSHWPSATEKNTGISRKPNLSLGLSYK